MPLGLLNLWVGGCVLTINYLSMLNGKYDTIHFLPYFNFLCLLILYKVIIQSFPVSRINTVLQSMRAMILLTMFVCVLQYFDLSQFWTLTKKANDKYFNNLVVGFIGNGTHLSGFLASTIPLFLMERKRENYLALMLMGLIFFFAGENKGMPAASGFMVAGTILLYLLFHIRRNLFWFFMLTLAIIALIMTNLAWQNRLLDNAFWDTNGRLGVWKHYWQIFKQAPILGIGLGHINALYKTTPYPNVSKMHLEYYHYLIELGIPGLVLIGWMIKDFFSLPMVDTRQLALKAMVLGFLVSCCFNFAAHLWLPAIWAMCWYALTFRMEESLQHDHQKDLISAKLPA